MRIELDKITKDQWIKIAIAAGALLLLIGITLLLTLCGRKQPDPTPPPSRLDVFLADANREILVYDNGEVKPMHIEDYLPGVVAKEMPLSFDQEALKAQAVAARTYTIRKMADGGCGRGGADICTDHTHCQAYTDEIPPEYAEKVANAVQGSRGMVALHDNYPIKAMYHSTAGEKTEDNENVFGDYLPYLVSVDSPGEQSYRTYRQTVRLKREDVLKKVEDLRGARTKETITIRERNGSGRVKEADLFGHYLLGTQVRSLLELPSANFTVERQGEDYLFTCIGYGHGVGMSQIGADSQASAGKNYQEILQHYYTGIELKQYYE